MLLAAALAAQESVVRNGDFQQADADGNPAGWQCTLDENTVYMNQGGSRWLKVTNNRGATQKISLLPEWRWLYISARMKARGVVLGEKSWNDVRLNCFYTTTGVEQNHYTAMPLLKGDSDWVEVDVVSTIPTEAKVDTLTLNPVILCAGEAGFDDIIVIPLSTEAEMKAKLGPIMNARLPRLVNGALAAGSFKNLGPNGLPKEWTISMPTAAKIEPLGSVNALVLTKYTGAGTSVNAVTRLKPEPGWKAVKIKARVAGSGIVCGKESYDVALIQVLFKDYAGNKITENWPSLGVIPAGDVDWQDYEVEVPVPARDDCYLSIDIALRAASGTYKVSNLRVEPVQLP
jgi:hypothetical protein